MIPPELRQTPWTAWRFWSLDTGQIQIDIKHPGGFFQALLREGGGLIRDGGLSEGAYLFNVCKTTMF